VVAVLLIKFGPLRSSSRLSPAITELEDQGFVSEMKHGRKTIIVIHEESARGAH